MAKNLHNCGQEKHTNLSKGATEVISVSWRDGTEKRYNSHIKEFIGFCAKRMEDPIQATVEIGIEFLTKYYITGTGNSSVNFARRTLSSIIKPADNAPFERSTLACRFMNGVFNLTLALSRYIATWSMTKVFNHIKGKSTLPTCDLKTGSHRLTILLCLTIGQKDQTIQCFNLDYIKILNEKAILFVAGKLNKGMQ